jgi:hypothetical protein
MFAPIRPLLSQFFSRSSTINNEPLNKVSLIVIIVIDIFILINVFIGLGDISQWHISPSQAYPCYFDWSNYRSQTTDRDYTIVRTSIEVNRFSSLNPSEPQPSVRQTYLDAEEGHLDRFLQLVYSMLTTKTRSTTLPIDKPSKRSISGKPTLAP